MLLSRNDFVSVYKQELFSLIGIHFDIFSVREKKTGQYRTEQLSLIEIVR